MTANDQRGVNAPAILIISPYDPSGETFGSLVRLRSAISALSLLAPIDLAIVKDHPAENRGVVVVEGVRRAEVFSWKRKSSPLQRIRWLVRPTVPLDLFGNDYTPLHVALEPWLDSYSLIWIVRTATYDAVRSVLPAATPHVVDVDDLESDKLLGMVRARRSTVKGRRRGGGFVRDLASQIQNVINAHAWRVYDEAVARRVDAAIVCSRVDAESLGGRSTTVIPNTYPPPPAPLGSAAIKGSPTVLMQGQLEYGPNVDAAEFFVYEVLPLLRVIYPNLDLRLVGRNNESVQRLAREPNVTVCGFVDNIEDELRRADLVVAPIRFGGGTRIKILEAFAHHIPVVSTRIGSFGLDAMHGVHLLNGDSASDFATACVAALSDEGLRSRLVKSARDLYDACYRPEIVEQSIRTLAGRLITRA